MEKETLYDLVCQDVEDRKIWANDCETWYKLRGPGIRRLRKPWSHAADMHYPLADGTIDNWKPFYTQQLFSTDLLADFVAEPGIPDGAIQEPAYWFDYKLKEKSNLEEELNFSDDHMMVYARGILKTTWDMNASQLHYKAIEPLHLIVPSDTITLDEAPRITHVKHLSPWDYKHGKDTEKYRKDEQFVCSITGGSESDNNSAEHIKRLARGITHSEKKIIIVWEIWCKEKDSKGNIYWEVSTVSPMRPNEPIRSTFKCPYTLPDNTHPFTDFVMEARQGYYEARGICEILSEFEQALNKTWNEKLDAMTLYNRPLFSATKDMPNTGNIKFMPGQILPFEVRALQTGAPPISFDTEMTNTRVIAQQRVAVPDFGVSDQLYGGNKSSKTATEIESISGTQQLMVGQRSRIYRRRLARLYNISWALLMQYDDDLAFVREGLKQSITDKKIFDSIISIAPAGTSDSWDQHRRFQKSLVRYNTYKNDPFIQQGELRKHSLELDEPGLVKRLYIDPMDYQKNQQERQMIELLVIEAGMPIGINPDDDHAIHLDTMYQRAIQQLATQTRPNPQSMKPAQQHMMEHITALQEQNPKLAKDFAKRFAQLAQAIQQKAQADMAHAQGVLPPQGPPQGQLGPPPSAAPPPGAATVGPPPPAAPPAAAGY